ncbi:MAG: G1 family glutamic endopeptidase [Clostridia bacterium]
MQIFRAGGTVAAVLLAAFPAVFAAPPAAAQAAPVTASLTLGSPLSRLHHAAAPLRGSPSLTTLYSSNWAGFIDGVTTTTAKKKTTLISDGATFTSVSASWTVPQLQASPANSVAASWVGLGGVIGPTTQGLLQAGTIEEYVGTTPEYMAFVEDYPNPVIYLSKVSAKDAIVPGDTVTVTVAYANGAGSVTVSDTTQNWTSVTPISGSSFPQPNNQSAEWIMEDPECGHSLCTFANVSPTAFTSVMDTASVYPTSRTPLETMLVKGRTDEVSISPTTIGSATSSTGNYNSFTITQTGTSGGGGRHHGPRSGR